jgi:hypothetical protein
MHCIAVPSVVQNRPVLGYTVERWRLLGPGSDAKLVLCGRRSVPRSSALRLNGSEAQQRQPVRMALAGHQSPRAFAAAFGYPAAHEAAMVPEEL